MADYIPLQAQAYEYLKHKILTGKLVPNTIYSETRLAAECGVSRTPMKDALVRLSQDRFIDIIPSKGFRLHQMSVEDVWSTYQARTAIEGFCALQLAQGRTTAEGQDAIHRLESSIIAMRRAIESAKSKDSILAYDLHFHQILVSCSNNREFMQMFESYNHRLYAIAMDSFQCEGRPEKALQEHELIYNAITAEPEVSSMEAYLAVMHHMEASRDIALQHKSFAIETV